MSVRDDTIQPGEHTHAQRYRVLPDLCMLLIELKCVREHKLYIVRKVCWLGVLLSLQLFLLLLNIRPVTRMQSRNTDEDILKALWLLDELVIYWPLLLVREFHKLRGQYTSAMVVLSHVNREHARQ